MLAAPTGGLATGLVSLIHVSAIAASAIVSVGLSVVAGVAMKALGLTAKVGSPSTTNATPQTYRQTIANSQIVYGTRRLGGLLCFYHPKKSGDYHYRYFVIAVAGHQVKGALRWFLNDNEVSVDGSGMVTTGDYASNAWVWFDRGAVGTPAFSTFVDECDGRWGANHLGGGIAKAYAKFRLTDGVTSAGMPNITVEVQGKDDVLDPRSETRGFTNNAQLVFYDWLALARAEGGVGAADDEIDWDFVGANANVCDELVTAADGGQEARYRFDGIITTGAAPSEVRDSFIVNCAGRFCYSEGHYVMRPGYWVPPGATLDEDDLTAAITVSRYRSANEVATEVQGTYIDPALLYQAQPFDTQSVTSSSVVSMDLDLAWTLSRGQAERVASIMLRRANAEKTVKWPMNFAGLGVSAMDTVLLGTARHGLSNYSWTVTDWQLNPDFSIALSLAEENEEIYEDGSPNPRAPYAGLATVPDVIQPGATAWTVTGNVLTGAGASTPTIIVSGACDDRSADAIVIEYRVHADGQADDAGWRSAGIEATTVTVLHITSIAGGLSYDVSVTYRRNKLLGPRRIVGAVSAGAVALNFVNVTGPTKPDDNATNSADPNSPLGSNAMGPFGPNTVGSFTFRVVTLENALGAGGTVQAQFAQLQQEVEAGGGGQTVSRVTSLEASARGAGDSSPNLVLNPQFTDGTLGGWTVGAGSWVVVQGYDVGPFAQCGTANSYLYQDVAVSAGGAYSLSADMSPDQAQGCYVKVDWLNATGGFISASQSVYASGWARGYTADNALVAPTGAAKARVYCTIANANANGRFSRIQFQRGGVPSAFRDDGDAFYNASRLTSEVQLRTTQAGTYAQQFNSLTSQFAGTQGSWLKSQVESVSQTVSTTNQTLSQKIDTLTSSITAIGAPNLLANGSFANGLAGWTQFGGASWTVVTTYTPIFAQSANNGYSGLYSDVSGVQPGLNYCFGFEASDDSGDNQVYLSVQWLNASGSTVRQDNGTGTSGAASGWGNRISNGPFQAPAGATTARVCVYLYGAGSGFRRVSRIQFQQSDQPTAYSDPASLQGLQAQVSQQAATIADISANKLGAFWQVAATAGNQSASISAVATSGGTSYSAIELIASQFTVKTSSGAKPIFGVSGDTVFVNGNLVVTDSIVDNSVSAILSATLGTSVSGNNNTYSTPISANLHLDRAATVTVIYTGAHTYSGGLPEWEGHPIIDGQTYNGAAGGDGYAAESFSFTVSAYLGAGDHTIGMQWRGGTAAISLVNGSTGFTAIAIKK